MKKNIQKTNHTTAKLSLQSTKKIVKNLKIVQKKLHNELRDVEVEIMRRKIKTLYPKKN